MGCSLLIYPVVTYLTTVAHDAISSVFNKALYKCIPDLLVASFSVDCETLFHCRYSPKLVDLLESLRTTKELVYPFMQRAELLRFALT